MEILGALFSIWLTFLISVFIFDKILELLNFIRDKLTKN